MDNTFYEVMSGIESNGKYDANRKGSAYYGKYQFRESTAAPYLAKLGKTWTDYQKDPSVQEAVVRMETDRNKRIMTGWGKENPSQLDLWTAHNLGIGNMRKIYKGDVNDPNLIAAIQNQTDNPKDVNEYLAMYGKKFGVQPKQDKAILTATDPQGRGLVPTQSEPQPTQSEKIASLFEGLGSIQKPVEEEEMPVVKLQGLGRFAGF